MTTSSKILSLEIKNFRKIHNLEINFNYSKNKQLDILEVGNRYGKTNVLNAILWCLYGNEFLSKENEEKEPIKNEHYPQEKTYVKITLLKSNTKYTISREDKNELVMLKSDEEYKGGISVPMVNPEFEIEEYFLPFNLSKFFLFKGEFLTNFFNNSSSLRETILETSGLNYLEKLKDKLDELIIKYGDEIIKKNKNDQNLKNLTFQKKEKEKEINLHKEDCSKYKEKLEKVNSDIGEIEENFKGVGINKAIELMNSSINLNKNKSDLEGQNKTLNSKVKEIFLDKLSRWFLYRATFKFKRYLEDLANQGIIPPPISIELINRILDEKECICGTKIDKTIEKRLKEISSRLIENQPALLQLNNINLTLEIDKKTFEKDKETINSYLYTISENQKTIKNIEKDIEINKKAIGKIDNEEISRLEGNLTSLRNQKKRYEELINNEEETLKNLKEEMQDITVNYNKTLSRIGNVDILKQKMKFTDTIKFEITRLITRIEERLLKNINQNTKNYFNQLFQEHYGSEELSYSIEIDKEFKIHFVSPTGREALNSASTGEKKILALSFIAALSEFYGFDFPIIIDAPFSDLGIDIILKVLDTLETLSKNRQVIILTLNLGEEVMSKLKKVATEYYKFINDKYDNTLIDNHIIGESK